MTRGRAAHASGGPPARRRVALLTAAAVVLVAAVAAGALLAARGEAVPAGPKAPIPRVCWFSDYANAKLSNRCTYRAGERRWYMEDEHGETVPADTQRLPPANLCHYFSGTACPKR